MTKPRTHEEIAARLRERCVNDVAEYFSRWASVASDALPLHGVFLVALREAADAALAGRCHCGLEGEPGRETIIHECQVHAESRLRYAGQAADAAREEVIAKANEAWLEGHDEAALNATDLKCRIKDLLLERRRAEAALAKWAEHECESHTGCAEALVAARQEEHEALLRTTDALRSLLTSVDARLLLASGFTGMGYNIAQESAGRLRVDAEYGRKTLAWLDARSRAEETISESPKEE